MPARMIHELRSYVIAEGRLADYLEAAGRVGRAIRGDDYGKLEGHWFPLLGSPSPDRVVHLWSFRDFAERDRLRGELAKNERWAKEFLPLLPPLVLRQENRILAPACPFNAVAGHGNVYELCVERTTFGGAGSFERALLAALPAPEESVRNVGVWQTSIGTLNEVVHLWAYPSMEVLLGREPERLADPRWQRVEELRRTVVVERDVQHLTASFFSPIQ
jgi:hypothetical protein